MEKFETYATSFLSLSGIYGGGGKRKSFSHECNNQHIFFKVRRELQSIDGCLMPDVENDHHSINHTQKEV